MLRGPISYARGGCKLDDERSAAEKEDKKKINYNHWHMRGIKSHGADEMLKVGEGKEVNTPAGLEHLIM